MPEQPISDLANRFWDFGNLSRSQTSFVLPRQARLTTMVSTCGPSRRARAAAEQRLR